MKFIINVLICGLVVLAAAYLVPGVVVDGLWTAIIVAAVLAIVNATVGLLLRLFTFPLNFLTFGLVGFVISVLMILLTDNLIAGFSVSSFWTAALFAIILGIIQGFIGSNDD